MASVARTAAVIRSVDETGCDRGDVVGLCAAGSTAHADTADDDYEVRLSDAGKLVALELGEWQQTLGSTPPATDARIVVRTNRTRMMVQAVREGLAITALPCCICGPDRKLDRVPAGAALELDGIWLVVHRDVQRTPRVRAVIDALEARLGAMPAS